MTLVQPTLFHRPAVKPGSSAISSIPRYCHCLHGQCRDIGVLPRPLQEPKTGATGRPDSARVPPTCRHRNAGGIEIVARRNWSFGRVIAILSKLVKNPSVLREERGAWKHTAIIWRRGLGGIGTLVLGFVPLLCGASFRTSNFVVEAPNPSIARTVAEHAEADRVKIARAWLGRELPAWTTPCPIRVKVTSGEAGGLTSFGFNNGRVTDQSMVVEGRLDRILASALPHEITHTIFAAYFGGPMPRWADEGASLLSEDQRERSRHDQIAVDLLARRGEVSLVRLFKIEEYPKDLMSFYGQGYSISRFLIEIGGRPRFLHFVRDGLKSGWDIATLNHYGLADVRELDRAWRSWHRVSLTARVQDRDEGDLVYQDQPTGNDEQSVGR